MKRKVKKQIKEDLLVNTVTKVIDFSKHRKKEIMLAAAAILVLIVAVIGVRLIKAGSNTRENRILSHILSLSEELKDHPEKLQELEKLAGSGKFSRMAHIQLAAYWIERQDFEKAEAELGKIPARTRDTIYYQSRDMLAQVFFYQKKYEEALAIYDELEKAPGDYFMDVIYFHKAEVLERKGEIEKALELFKKIQDEYSQTYFGYEASQKVQKLEEKK